MIPAAPSASSSETRRRPPVLLLDLDDSIPPVTYAEDGNSFYSRTPSPSFFDVSGDARSRPQSTLSSGVAVPMDISPKTTATPVISPANSAPVGYLHSMSASVIDSGLSVIDSGPSVIDSGPSVIYSGPSVIDSGPSVIYSGPSVIDSGPSVIYSDESIVDDGDSLSFDAGASKSAARSPKKKTSRRLANRSGWCPCALLFLNRILY